MPAWKNQLAEKLQEQGGVPFHAQQPRLTFSGIKDTLDMCSPSLPTFGTLSEYQAETESFSTYVDRVKIFFAANDVAVDK